MSILPWVRRFRRVYSNWPSVTLAFLTQTHPKRVVTRNGHTLLATGVDRKSYQTLAELVNDYGWSVEQTEGDLVRIKSPFGFSIWVRWNISADLWSLYEGTVQRCYGESFEGMTVVDIGAYMGDTVLWFSARGAERVIGFEPNPANYTILQKNTLGAGNKVSVFPYAIAGSSGETRIASPEGKPNQTHIGEDGTSVPARTLAEMMQELKIDKIGLLKMDVEGAEYEILKSLDEATWGRIARIRMEIHKGLQDLPLLFKSHGFEWSEKWPSIVWAQRTNA